MTTRWKSWSASPRNSPLPSGEAVRRHSCRRPGEGSVDIEWYAVALTRRSRTLVDLSRGERQFPAGFTLIEMMLAIGVLGLILAMLATSFNTVAHSKVHAEGRLLVDREGRALLWQISKEVRDAVQTIIAPSHVLLLGGGHSGSSGPLDTLTLSTLDAGHRRAVTGIAPEYIVSYNEVSNPDHRGWYLLQRTQQSELMLAPAASQSTVLADNLLSLHLRYFDGQRWTESWDSTGMPPGRQLPVAVAIQIQMAGPGGRAIDFATQVTVPMAIAQW